MGMSLLNLVSEFCKRQSLPIPPSVTNAQDADTQQIWGLLNEGAMDLADRYEWQQLVLTSTAGFVSAGSGPNQWIAAVLDDSTTAGSPSIAVGWKAMLPRTFWETTTRLEVYGPLTEQEWMVTTTMQVQPTRYSFKIDGQNLWIYPYSSTATFTFMYFSRFSVLTGTTYTEAYTLDTSQSLLPDRIVLQDVKWRWKAAKGLPYAEDARICEQMIVSSVGRQILPWLSLDEPHPSNIVGPGLLVAAGSWPL